MSFNTVIMGADIPVSFSISGGISAQISTSREPFEASIDIVPSTSASYIVSGAITSNIEAPSSGVSFEAAVGTIINAGIRRYTADEDLPDEVDGQPNPAKNILVNNMNRTIHANLLSAAQIAAMLS